MIKKLRALIAVALVCAVAAAAPACTSTHEHDVNENSWRVITEATCISEGVMEGICATCGASVYKTIPIDETAHAYGDWVVTQTPTETVPGTATKTCTLNRDASHQSVISLPALTDSAYTSTITKRPTATETGIRTYVYPHDLGDVTFTVEISNTGITSVRDAVDVACGDEGHDFVRNGTGTVTMNAYANGGSSASFTSNYDFFYEYGTNYTHIDNKESDSFERWYGIDSDGEIYGYASYKNGTPYEETKTTAGATSYYYGYRYLFTYATYVGTFYGTESFISGLYTAARVNMNGDFTESIDTSGSETVYSFSYGEYTIGTSASYFSVIEVEFTLSGEYTIKDCTVTCTTHVSTTDSESWVLDDDGHVDLKSPTGIRYVNTYTLTQVTKEEDPTEPVNPYDAENMRITDFDVIYNDNIDENGNYDSASDIVIDDNTTINITANATTRGSYDSGEKDEDGNVIYNYFNYFRIENVKPTTMADSVSSDIAFYYRVYNGTSYVDYEINSNTATDNSVGIACNFDSSTNSFLLNCKISGDVIIVIKTSKTEKEIHLDVTPVAPSTLYPMLYSYSASGYSWTSSYKSSVTDTVYVGQSLYFSSEVPTTESKYADSAYTVSVTKAVDGEGNTISSEYYTLNADDTFYSQSMSSFVATKAGTYTLTLVSTRKSTVTSTITVTVVDVPDVSELFGGTYTTSLAYTPKGTISVTFEAGEESGVYYATVASSNGVTEVLKCTYDGVTLTTEHYSGAESADFTLELNEAYDLVLSHPTGFFNDDGSDILETKILTKLSS